MKEILRVCLVVWIFWAVAAVCMEMEDLAEAPNEYCCPITREVMTDPVLASDGFTYERSAIQRVFSTNTITLRSPVTNEPFENITLLPNRVLRSLINDWKHKSFANQGKLEESQISFLFVQEKSLRDMLMFESDFSVTIVRTVDYLKEQNRLQTSEIETVKAENSRLREDSQSLKRTLDEKCSEYKLYMDSVSMAKKTRGSATQLLEEYKARDKRNVLLISYLSLMGVAESCLIILGVLVKYVWNVNQD